MNGTRDAVIARSRALAALYVRARVEGGLRYSSGESKKKWAALGRRLAAWARANAEFSPKEERLFAKTLGTWPEQKITDGIWRLEGLGTLLWALSLRPSMPAWDRPCDPKVLRLVDAPSWFDASDARAFTKARLRTEESLVHAFECAELLHWRTNTPTVPETAKLRRIVADAAKAAASAGFIKQTMKNDFPFRRHPFTELTDDLASEAHSIAFERHYALCWLTGDEAWDDVQADT